MTNLSTSFHILDSDNSHNCLYTLTLGVLLPLVKDDLQFADSQNNTSAIADIRNQGIEVVSIITLFDIINYLNNKQELTLVEKLRTYHGKYGV